MDLSSAQVSVVHRRRWATLMVLCISLAIIGLDTTVLNVALPTLQRELSATASELQWIVDAYTVAFAGLLLLAGALGDKLGRKRALLAGLVVFGASSVWGALVSSPEQLIAARTVMGIGGALIMPSTLSILTNAFTDPSERKKAIGIWSGVSGIGIAVGPALGGWLLEHFSWPSVFYLNVPVAGVGLLLGLLIVPESRDAAAPRLDWLGGLLSVAGLTTLVWSIIEAPDRGWTDPVIISGFAVSLVVLAGFTLWELRTPHPLLNVRFFANRRFSIPSVSITLVFFALFGSAFFLSIYLQAVQGHDALGAGIRILPLAIGMTFGAPLAMAIAQRIGEKIPLVFGLLLLSSSFVVIAGTTEGTGYWRVFNAILLMGFGMGFAMAPATEAVMGSLPPSKAGVGSAVNDTVRQVGGALGVAVLGSILNSVYADRLSGSAVAELPAPAADAAQDNVQSALAVAARLPAQAGEALASTAKSGFIDAMDTTVVVAAVVVAVGAVVALFLMPHHGQTRPEGPDEADSGAVTDQLGSVTPVTEPDSKLEAMR